MMNRRGFLRALSVSLLAAPVVAEAQRAKTVPRIGFLQPGEAPRAWIDAFRQGLADQGWVERQSVIVEHRFAATIADIAPLIAELISLKVDVIVTWSTPAVLAAKQATGTIPIVGVSGNPVEIGLAASLARPAGNVTGIAILTADLEVKNLQLLKQTVPSASRVAVLWNPDNPLWVGTLKRLQETAPGLGVRLQSLEVRAPGDLEKAFASARGERADTLLVVREALFGIHRKQIADLALQYRLPSIYGSPRNVEAGGLMSYAAPMADMLRRAAVYVDKLLKGANPAELPIEQPTKFELVITLKTAKTLGLTIPPSILLRADQIIE